MAKQVSFKTQMINISSNKRGFEKYKKLFDMAYNLKTPIRTRGESYMILQSRGLKFVDGNETYIMGTIARFTELDIDGKWFDIEELDEANDEDLEDINIPENLRPNMKSYYYLFDTTKHKFIFEHYGEAGILPTTQVETFLKTLFNHKKIKQVFGQIEVNVVSNLTSVEKLFSLATITKVQIEINRPNPDDLGDLEKKIEERLRNTNTRRIVEEYTVTPGQSIEADDYMKSMAQVSTINGYTRVNGRDENGVSQKISTKEFPATEGIKYNPGESSPIVEFKRAARQMLS